MAFSLRREIKVHLETAEKSLNNARKIAIENSENCKKAETKIRKILTDIDEMKRHIEVVVNTFIDFLNETCEEMLLEIVLLLNLLREKEINKIGYLHYLEWYGEKDFEFNQSLTSEIEKYLVHWKDVRAVIDKLDLKKIPAICNNDSFGTDDKLDSAIKSSKTEIDSVSARVRRNSFGNVSKSIGNSAIRRRVNSTTLSSDDHPKVIEAPLKFENRNGPGPNFNYGSDFKSISFTKSQLADLFD